MLLKKRGERNRYCRYLGLILVTIVSFTAALLANFILYGNILRLIGIKLARTQDYEVEDWI